MLVFPDREWPGIRTDGGEAIFIFASGTRAKELQCIIALFCPFDSSDLSFAGPSDLLSDSKVLTVPEDMPLDIIIVGSGIAGLATGIGLLAQGHQVRIYERRDASNFEETGSGIQLQTNINHILMEWGMLDAVKKIAHDNVGVDMRDQNGSTIGQLHHQGPTYYASRQAYKSLFRDVAVSRGAQIHENCVVQAMEPGTSTVIFADGSRALGDIIIGADGSGSKVRQALFPDYIPIMRSMACFQVTLPLEKVGNDALLRDVISGPNNTMTIAPGRSIFASPAPAEGVFDMQFIDHEYTLEQDPNSSQPTERIYDLVWLRQRWSDHSAAHRKALDIASSAFKWRFVEVFGLPSWSNAKGNVVLVGDACHAMTPFAGQGTAMVIEDAAVLAKLLGRHASVRQLPRLVMLYEKARRPRAEKVQGLAAAYGRSWASKDTEHVRSRNAQIQLQSSGRTPTASKQDANAPYGSPDFLLWLNQHNVLEGLENVDRELAKL